MKKITLHVPAVIYGETPAQIVMEVVNLMKGAGYAFKASENGDYIYKFNREVNDYNIDVFLEIETHLSDTKSYIKVGSNECSTSEEVAFVVLSRVRDYFKSLM